jgi:hypothetical protein
MRSRLKHVFATGTTVCVMALSFQVLAAAVEPIEVQGRPSAQLVAELCEFPKVTDKAGINSPVEVAIQAPQTGTFPQGEPLHGIFQVSIIVNGKTLSFEDVSNDPGSPDSTDSQFYDIRGTEAVVAESQNSTNIYCNVNSIKDSDLQAPSDALAAVRVFWVTGPSGFESQEELQPVCDALNDQDDRPDRVTDFFVSHHDRPDVRIRNKVTLATTVDFNGCNNRVPRFCNAQDLRGDEFVVTCHFDGFDTTTDTTVLGACCGSSGGSRICC